MCYNDRTYCPFKDCKEFDKCYAALTEKIEKDAKRTGYWIAKYIDKPNCFEKK